MFGVLLLILAVLSVIWHSSNAPDSRKYTNISIKFLDAAPVACDSTSDRLLVITEYIDLWSMDSCIAYLIVRIAW